MPRNVNDFVLQAIARVAPGGTSLFSTPDLNQQLSSRVGVTFLSLTNNEGIPFFMVGNSIVGQNNVVG